MKKNLFSIKQLIFIFLLLIGLKTNSHAQVTNYATLPYYQGFESGALDSNWYKTSSMASGRVRIWPSDTLIWGGDTAMAVAGNKFLGMDMPTGGTFNLNEAWLGLNTIGASSLYFSFWWSDWNDETSPEDGVYISDNGGATFTKVLDLLGGSNPDLNWVYYNLNLDSINQVRGLNYGPNYVIKFQQYDDYYMGGGNDGFLFDEINIASVVTSINSKNNNLIGIYPNPTEADLYIQGLDNTANLQINIINTLGQKLISESFSNSSTVKLDLNISPGIYFVEIVSADSYIIKEFVKK